jgi:hypothetical protein
MLRTCSEPGCTTIVMGGRCLEHERGTTRVFVRGRPFAAPALDTAGRVITTASAEPVSSVDLYDSTFALRRR